MADSMQLTMISSSIVIKSSNSRELLTIFEEFLANKVVLYFRGNKLDLRGRTV